MLLVTGGAGYIGSHFLHEITNTTGESIVVVDNLSEGHEQALPPRNVTLVKGSIGDTAVLDKVFTEHKIDAVIHFAASAYVGESQQKPFKYLQNNVVKSINLFEAMERHGVRRIIFSSSCATYGNPKSVPLDEQHVQEPINVYGNTKLIVEKILRSLNETAGWSFVALRYFNAAGAAPDGSIGESHDPETHLVPLVLQAASGKIPHITIHGDDYPTPDGTCIRDYVHVCDLAVAHRQALQVVREQQVAEFVNIGTEEGASVKELIATCRAVTGINIKEKIGPRRPGDPPALVAKSIKAAQLLGWKPQHNLTSVIQTAWSWERNRKY